jgi:hypothetical protein
MIVETLCAYCHHYFSHVKNERAGGRAPRYCSSRCRQAAYRDRAAFAVRRSRYDCSGDPRAAASRLAEPVQERTRYA